MNSPYIPVTKEQQDRMLNTLGLTSKEELFSAIPESLRLKKDLELPAPLSEYELKKHIRELTQQNFDASWNLCFLGAGLYDHMIPSAVKHILSRQEFYTAYTPYQPEISQGVLQSIFEYQTMICELTGMDGANASMYDGATALYEAVLLAHRQTERNEIIMARSVNPQYRRVVASGLCHSGLSIKEIGFEIPTVVDSSKSDGKGGRVVVEELIGALNDNTAAVVIQSPNFFGTVEDLKAICEKAKAKGAMVIAVCDLISLGLFESPGVLGADIAVGEAQPLGNPMNYGGPLLGYFAVKAPYIRRMPGRIAGETTDAEGRRGFVLTLQAREQHI
ncbi:MAG: aminomethyl-transferring glycine dehydrogenase subunit GcvPA [Clostridia bacterium]|nr:aminomethyl-transferring glycine dehydrogenase subunit GcvPA [Clostridia bacterium]